LLEGRLIGVKRDMPSLWPRRELDPQVLLPLNEAEAIGLNLVFEQSRRFPIKPRRWVADP
jgi:hypothetical protein